VGVDPEISFLSGLVLKIHQSLTKMAAILDPIWPTSNIHGNYLIGFPDHGNAGVDLEISFLSGMTFLACLRVVELGPLIKHLSGVIKNRPYLYNPLKMC